MKKLLIGLCVLILILPIGAVVAFNSGIFHARLEREIHQSLNLKPESGDLLKLGPMQLSYAWPLKLSVGSSFVRRNQMQISLKSLQVSLASLFSPWDVRVKIAQPIVTLPSNSEPTKETVAAKPEATTAPTSPSGLGLVGALPIHLTLTIENGEVHSTAAQVKGLELSFHQAPLLGEVPATLHLSGVLSTQMVAVGLNFRVDTEELIATTSKVQTAQLQASLAGLQVQMQGQSDFLKGVHRWKILGAIKDLSALPQEALKAWPGREWKGSLQFQSELSKDAQTAEWQGQGTLNFDQLRAILEVNREGITVTGPMLLNLKGSFSYFHNKMTLPSLSGALNLTSAEVKYQNLMHKAPGTDFLTTIQVSGDAQRIRIAEFSLKLAQIKAQVSGQVGALKPFPSDLKVVILPTALLGLEKMFPPLGKSPLNGEVSLKLGYQGPLTDPMKSRIQLLDMRLNNLVADVDFEKPKVVQVQGVVRANLKAEAEILNGAVRRAEGQGQLDLKQATLLAGPVKKANGQALHLDFQISNQGDRLNLKKFKLQSFVGDLLVSGSVDSPLTPKLDLNLDLVRLNLGALRLAVPEFRELIPEGTASGSLKILGPLKMEKPWFDWPLKVSGRMAAQIPEFKLKSAPAAPVKGAAGSSSKPAASPVTAPAAAEPFLPTGSLTSQARVNVLVNINRLIRGDLALDGVKVQGLYDKGHFKGEVGVAKIFDGSFHLLNMDVPVLEKRPLIEATAKWDAVTIEKALAFAKPGLQEMAQGKTQGRAEFSSLMPSDQEFLKTLKVRGDLAAQPVVLNTVKVGDSINEMIKSVSFLKIKPVKLDALNGQLNSRFSMQSEVVQISSLVAQDTGGSELKMSGRVWLSSMQGDLTGTFAWMGAPVQGCVVEGNADSKGRLVVPLALKGDLLKPKTSILGDLFTQLGRKALDCEKKKFVDRLKKDGGEKLKKEAEKALKGLFGH